MGEELKAEIVPKNILMIGPTGCGKTEIARRLSKMADAPFIKVEATKFTEVGFHGRDVDQIIRDLVEASIALTRKRKAEEFRAEAKRLVETRILDTLTGLNAAQATQWVGRAGTCPPRIFGQSFARTGDGVAAAPRPWTWTHRGDGVAATPRPWTWTCRGDESRATPWPRRGHAAETSRGDAAATTWRVRGRRGYDAESP